MDEAFDILGCPYQEKMDIYRVSALCMQLGRMEFQVYKNCNLSVNFDFVICRAWGRWLLQRTLTQHRPSTESASTATMKSSFTTASSIPNIRFIILSSLLKSLSSLWQHFLPQVGTEWVCKTQNVTAVTVGVGSIIKNVYGRLFRFIVDMCNATL